MPSDPLEKKRCYTCDREHIGPRLTCYACFGSMSQYEIESESDNRMAWNIWASRDTCYTCGEETGFPDEMLGQLKVCETCKELP